MTKLRLREDKSLNQVTKKKKKPELRPKSTYNKAPTFNHSAALPFNKAGCLLEYIPHGEEPFHISPP